MDIRRVSRGSDWIVERRKPQFGSPVARLVDWLSKLTPFNTRACGSRGVVDLASQQQAGPGEKTLISSRQTPHSWTMQGPEPLTSHVTRRRSRAIFQGLALLALHSAGCDHEGPATQALGATGGDEGSGAGVGGSAGLGPGSAAAGSGGGDAVAGGGGASSADSGGSSNVGDTAGDGNVDAGHPSGLPIQAPDRQWTWVDFPGAHCRDGSGTGIGVNWIASSKKLAIFLDGGGACFNAQTCAMNPAKRGSMFNGSGIFDRSNAQSPLTDWNLVFVPYCTGDLHAGNNPQGSVPGVGPQQFVGYANLELFLDRLVPTFPDATQILLTGVSSGGLGVISNASHVARRFPSSNVVALDDSGPPTSTAALPACFQRLMRQLWNLDATALADCGGDCAKQDDFMLDLALHFVRGRNHVTGILNSYDDATDIAWYNYGAAACPVPASTLTPPTFEAALLDLRRTGGSAAGQFATYYVPATSHTWIGGPFYSTTVNGTRLSDWTRNLLAGTCQDIGP